MVPDRQANFAWLNRGIEQDQVLLGLVETAVDVGHDSGKVQFPEPFNEEAAIHHGHGNFLEIGEHHRLVVDRVLQFLQFPADGPVEAEVALSELGELSSF
ncbi:hypothetical protein AAF143_14040 [Cyanobium sp. ATX-6F1]